MLKTPIPLSVYWRLLKFRDLDDLESPAVASHPLRVNCYFGRGYSPNRPRAVEVNRPYLSRHERKESERFKSFTYEQLARCDP